MGMLRMELGEKGCEGGRGKRQKERSLLEDQRRCRGAGHEGLEEEQKGLLGRWRRLGRERRQEMEMNEYEMDGLVVGVVETPS